ncbi:MAG: hypothetical protein HXY23_06550 [Parvularculaceae bacterium]|jgi:hypothetical protein|nr:hypothetical protein [Parvularculaceae bacterium]
MEGIYAFPADLRALAEEQTRDGERILWAGRPAPARAFLTATPIWLFAVPWTVVSCVFFGSSLAAALGLARIEGMERGAAWGFLLFSLPFFGIGLGLLAAPFIVLQEARRTAFVITDRRVLSLTANRSRTVKGLAASALRGAEARRFANGRGTVKALGPVGRDSDGDRVTDEIVMSGIADPSGAEQAVWSLVESARRRP